MKNYMLLYLLFPLLLFIPEEAVGSAESVLVAWYNVENLFDIKNDPYAGDDEFTPKGDKKWTRKRLHEKFKGLTRVIGMMNAGEGPDLLGLAEIEHRSVLERWNRKYLRRFNYGIAYHESPDLRSIDLALFYRKDIFSHVATNGHTVELETEERPTRDITVFTLTAGAEDTLDCVLVHWPSRYGGKALTEPKRISAAKVTSQVVDSLYAIREHDDILIMGDFNDDPDDPSVQMYLKAQDLVPEGQNDRRLHNSMLDIHSDPVQGTYYYRGEWNTLDQIILGRGLFDQEGFGTEYPDAAVFVQPFMRVSEGEYKDTPYRTHVGPRYLGCISDHFPILLTLTLYN